jgi:hypothetical protein
LPAVLNLSNLTELNLAGNQLVGTLPPQLASKTLQVGNVLRDIAWGSAQVLMVC